MSWPPPEGGVIIGVNQQVYLDNIRCNMTLLAVLGIDNKLRVDVSQVVETCKRSGVFLRMISSDDVLTAKVIAEYSQTAV